jgi:hypothetical protein
MKIKLITSLLIVLFVNVISKGQSNQASITLQSAQLKPAAGQRSITIDGLFFETFHGRVQLPPLKAVVGPRAWTTEVTATDGHKVSLAVQPQGRNFQMSLKAQPGDDIQKWGLAIVAASDEYYTGLMERVVDGPQAKSWATGIQEAMNLRGQKVDVFLGMPSPVRPRVRRGRARPLPAASADRGEPVACDPLGSLRRADRPGAR